MMKKLRDNKGYTIIELLVVIALIAVGVGAFTISVGIIASNNVRSCAIDIETMISKGKINSNYREPRVYIVIRVSDDGASLICEYFEGGLDNGTGGTLAETKVLGSAGINVNTTGFTTAGLPVRLAFDRSTGEMLELGASGLFEPFDPANLTANAKARITLTNLGGTRYIVELTPFTGVHEVRQ